MMLMIDLEPEIEQHLQSAAIKRGLPAADYVKDVLVRQVLPLSLRVISLSPEEQDQRMTAAAEELMSLYSATFASMKRPQNL